MNIATGVSKRPETLPRKTFTTPAPRINEPVGPRPAPAIQILVNKSWVADLDVAAVAGASSIIAFKLFLLGLLLFAI